MKGELKKSYNESQAAVRVSAAMDGMYQFEKVKCGSVVDGGGVVLGVAKDYKENANDDNLSSELDEDLTAPQWTVSYSKGIEGKGMYKDQVEIVPWADVKVLLELMYRNQDEDGMDGDKDGRLRPVLIAQLSP